MINLRRSLVINFLSSTGGTIAQFFTSLILARMLSPSEIGVFSITIVFVNIAHIFRDFGVATYLQREEHLTPEKIRAAIGVLVTTSWVIAVALFVASTWIAIWFKEPTIAPVMRVLALGFIFIPFGAVTHALLTREFAADKQAIVMVAGTVSYVATCLGLAALGFGTMSLAWANLVNIIVCAIAYMPLRPKGIPVLPSFRHWGAVVKFGVGSLVTNTASSLNNAVPDMLLGKLSGAQHVGLFSRANSTVGIFSYIAGSTINYGAVSYVSQTHHRGESLTPLLNRAAALLTGLGWPILAATAILGREIVLALYGAKWLDAVPAIPALAISGALGMTFNYTHTALTALGRPYLSAVPTTVTFLIRVLCGWAFFDGTLVTFSWAICAATAVTIPVLLMQHHRYLAYTTSSLLKALTPSALVTVICVAACFLLRLVLPTHFPPLLYLLIIGVPLMVIWYGALRVTRHPLLVEVHHFYDAIETRIKSVFST